MRKALRLRLNDAAPALTLTLIGAAALATVVLGAPPSYGCGEDPPPGQEAAVGHFRVLAFCVLGVAAAASVVVLAYLRVRERRRPRDPRHPWRGLVIFLVLLALALPARVPRAYLNFAGLIAAELWVLPAVVLAGLSLLAAAPIEPSSRPTFTVTVAGVVLALLTLLGLWAALTDGGPVYC